jgi:hypothetical protein
MGIRRRKFRWIGHTLRTDDEQPSEVMIQWNHQGNRRRERPRSRWRKFTLREAGRRWSELRHLAAGRDKWKKRVDDLCFWWNYRIYYYCYYHSQLHDSEVCPCGHGLWSDITFPSLETRFLHICCKFIGFLNASVVGLLYTAATVQFRFLTDNYRNELTY